MSRKPVHRMFNRLCYIVHITFLIYSLAYMVVVFRSAPRIRLLVFGLQFITTQNNEYSRKAA